MDLFFFIGCVKSDRELEGVDYSVGQNSEVGTLQRTVRKRRKGDYIESRV